MIVITGASSGIGRATAREFASRGARLVLAARNDIALQAVAAECVERGGQAIVVRTDVSVEEQVLALARAAVDAYGRIDVWVGSASVMSYGSFEQTPSAIFRQIIETNLMGQVHGARAALRQFRRQGSGTLVMVGSLYSEVGSPLHLAVRDQQVRGARPRRGASSGAAPQPRHPHHRGAAGVDRHAHLPARGQLHGQPRASPPAGLSAGARGKAIVRSVGRELRVVVVGRTQGVATALHGIAPPVYDRAASTAQDLSRCGEGAPRSAGTVLARDR